MTPLDAMARAIDEKITGIYGSPLDSGESHGIACAALLALADSACPREELLPHDFTPRHWTMMRTMLHVVAEGQQ